MDIQQTACKLMTGELIHRDQLGTPEDTKLIYQCVCDMVKNGVRVRKQLHQIIKG